MMEIVVLWGGLVGVYDFQHSVCYSVAANGTVSVKAGSWFSFKMSEALAAAVTAPITLSNNVNATNWIKTMVVKREGDLVTVTQTQDFSQNATLGVIVKAGSQSLWSFGVKVMAGGTWRNYGRSAGVAKYYYQKNGQWVADDNGATVYPYDVYDYATDLPKGDLPSTCS